MGTAGVKNGEAGGAARRVFLIRASIAPRSFSSCETTAAAPEPLGAEQRGEGEEPPR